MSYPRKPFEPSLVDPALAAMDVDTSPPGPDSALEAEATLPSIRPGVASKVFPPRPIVLPEPIRAGTMQPLTGAGASSSTRVAHPTTTVLSGASAHHAASSRAAEPDVMSDLWHKSIREEFHQAYTRYLRMTGKAWPTSAELTVHGSVIRLVDIIVKLQIWLRDLTLLNAGGRITYEQWTGEGLSIDDWAVIAHRVVPGAPRCGGFRAATKTNRPIAKAIYGIFRRHLLAYRVNLLVGEVVEDMGAHPTVRRPTVQAAASAVIPAQSATSSTAAARPTARAAPVPLNALAPATEPIRRVSNVDPPTSRQALCTQFYAQKFGEYLHSKGLAMPTEAERTVCGKVIDLAQLLWFMNGCSVQLGRSLTAGDMAGLAVAHFNFPPHKHYFLGERDWRSFWGSTSEVANGLMGLYNTHLHAFLVHLGATKAAWQPALIARAKELSIVPAGTETMHFIHATDIAMVANGESAAARAIGIIADERPGVTGAADKSLSAQRHFALTLGFSPFVDIMKRVFKRVAQVDSKMIGGDRYQGLDLNGDEAKQWIQEWKAFSRHHERALIIGAKHIHETLKDDSDSEKLLFMMAAYDNMHRAGGLGAPSEQDIYAMSLGFPPRPLVNVGALLLWNVDYGLIWVKFDRLAGPDTRKVLYPLAPTNAAKVPPMMVDVRKHRPQSNHKAHNAKARLASLRKSITWIQPGPSGFKPPV